jgi:XTP/dITP diphosphohydrolase
MQVVLASSNIGKLRELASYLAPLGFDLVVQSALGVQAAAETGVTFVDNALLKARHAAAITGLPALADDSGIEVDALGGRPGVYSARYAGEGALDVENIHKLLEELRDVPPGKRTARYRCVIAFVRSAADPSPLLADGVWEGAIASLPRGLGGFGYDPIFIPAGFDRTAAELAAAQKSARSHRTQALRALVAGLGRQRA